MSDLKYAYDEYFINIFFYFSTTMTAIFTTDAAMKMCSLEYNVTSLFGPINGLLKL